VQSSLSHRAGRPEQLDPNATGTTGRCGLLVVGAFVEPAPLERYVSGDLAQRLSTLGYPVQVTSRRSAKLWRVCNMLSSAVRLRTKYRLADMVLTAVKQCRGMVSRRWMCLAGS
jgi:hypothetical protein